MRRVTVREWERVVRFDRGRLAGVLEPGRHWLWRGGQELVRVDLRQRVLVMPLQEVLTADGVAVKVSLAAVWRVVDAVRFVEVSDSVQQALWVHLQLALRAPVAATVAESLLADRGQVAAAVDEAARPGIEALGVQLVQLAVRDLTFPGELKRVFAAVATAKQEARAALERARGETAALRSLANAARIAELTPALLQLRTLQVAEQAGGPVVLVPPGS